jgi:uncharacterized protein YjbJ (UPF0337 family)
MAREWPLAVKDGLRDASTRRMTQSTQDQIKGKLHELKGSVKEIAGQITNDPDLTAEGQNEHLAGTIQKKIGQIKQVFEK